MGPAGWNGRSVLTRNRMRTPRHWRPGGLSDIGVHALMFADIVH